MAFFEMFEHAFQSELAEFLRVALGDIESPSAVATEQQRRERRPINIASVG